MVFGIFRKRFFRKLRMSEREGSGSDEGSMDDNYEVEEIRAKMRGDDGEYLYYVKVGSQHTLQGFQLLTKILLQWVGWDSDTNTWEPKEHLDECPEKLEDFERKWRRKQEEKRDRKREDKERKRRERRERELKAAARFKVDSDSDGGAGAGPPEKRKEKKRVASSSESDSEEDRKVNDKPRKHKDDRDTKRDKAERRKEEAKRREERKPKFFRDIKPEKILGVTHQMGELYFYIKWEGDKTEPGLVKAKDAYQKIPIMCLKFYEQHLIWNTKEEKSVDAVSEPSQDTKTENDTPAQSQNPPSVDHVKPEETVSQPS